MVDNITPNFTRQTNNNDYKRIAVYIESALAKKIEQLALNNQKSKSYTIVQLIEKGLADG